MPGQSGSAQAAVADDFLVVDCLLPGKIRKLGKIRTFATARRPIRTSKTDCEIRGGEYTSYDRSNYETALQIWLPLAEGGDVKAQNYVGELYEKGIGGVPRYKIASDWYRKSAEQGLAAAQINLGALYERGLGVAQDKTAATSWYRKAAGLDAMQVDFVPGVGAEELELLRRERNAATSDRERLTNQLQELRRQLEDAQEQLSNRPRTQVEPSEDQQKAAALRDAEARDLKGQISGLQQRMAQLAVELQTAASSKEDALAGQRDEIRALRDQLAARQAETSKKEEEVIDLTMQLSARQTTQETQAAEAQTQTLKQALADAHGEAAARTKQSEAMSARLAALESSLANAVTKQAQTDSPAVQLADAGPGITIIDPPLVKTRGSRFRSAIVRTAKDEHVVIGKVSTQDDLMVLTANGAEVPLDENAIFRINVPVVERETEVDIVAIDVVGQRTALAFKLIKGSERAQISSVTSNAPGIDPKTAGIDFGSYFALVIGNNDYQHLPDLNSARNDAEMVSRILRDNYGFKVTTLYNASRYDILSTLNKLREELTDEDNLLLYYAGHGELDRVNKRGNWLPVDAEPDSTANWISNIQITDILNAMSSRQVMLVIDSCYSGTLTRAGLARIDGGMSDTMRLKWIKAMSKKRSRVVLTSGGVQPVLDGGGDGHSVFARAFLKALEENRGILEGQRLFQMVSGEVANASATAEFEQIPQYAPIKFAGHEAGDFFLVPMR